MALSNIVGLLFPLGVALTIGALALGLFYRDRTSQLRHDNHEDFTSDFHPPPGFDTKTRPNSSAIEEEKCIICLEVMKRFQSIRSLPCIHKFHTRCIQNWLRYDNICPTCRTVVP